MKRGRECGRDTTVHCDKVPRKANVSGAWAHPYALSDSRPFPCCEANPRSSGLRLFGQPGHSHSGCYDCISALAIERAGFLPLVSGAAVTASVLGYPDVGLQTMPEILNQAKTRIPLLRGLTGYSATPDV